jgi:hypothetical protein
VEAAVDELDTETLNARLIGGHRLLVTQDAAGRIIGCTVEFFGEQVPVRMFETYLANGMIGVPKDGLGYKVTNEGKKRLASSVRGRR